MIQKTQAFKSSDGAIHADIESAKGKELRLLLHPELVESVSIEEQNTIVEAILKYAPKVIDILTTTANSIPAARAVNGGKKPRKKNGANAEAQTLNTGYVPAAQ